MFVLSIVSVIIFFHFTTLGTSVFFVRESSRSRKHRFSPTIKLPDKSRKRLCIQRFSQRKGLENGCIAIHCKLLFVRQGLHFHTIQLRLRPRLPLRPLLFYNPFANIPRDEDAEADEDEDNATRQAINQL